MVRRVFSLLSILSSLQRPLYRRLFRVFVLTFVIRIHHGELDDIIPVRASEQMYSALRKVGAGATNSGLLKFTRYPDFLHDSWTAAYGNKESYEWMLNHRRKHRGDEKAVPEVNLVNLADTR